jgi:hypothetical protein
VSVTAKRLLLALAAGLVVTGAALADPLDPKVKYAPADVTRAKAIVLKQSDLGAAWANRTSNQAASLKAPVCPSLRPDYSKITLTGHAESVFDNGNGAVSIVSDVEIWKTKKQASRHMGALMKPALPACIRYALNKSVAGNDQVTLLMPKKQKFPDLADVSVRYRAPIAFKVGKQTVIVASDFVFLRKGRTEIYLNVTGPSNDRGLVSLQTRLAKDMLARVRG